MQLDSCGVLQRLWRGPACAQGAEGVLALSRPPPSPSLSYVTGPILDGSYFWDDFNSRCSRTCSKQSWCLTAFDAVVRSMARKECHLPLHLQG